MPESWRSFSTAFLTRWDVRCLFLPWEAASTWENILQHESERKKEWECTPCTPIHTSGHSTQQSSFSWLNTEESACSSGDKNCSVTAEIVLSPIVTSFLFHLLSPRFYFTSAAQVFSAAYLESGKTSPKLGQTAAVFGGGSNIWALLPIYIFPGTGFS